jgi:hypothetical protein
MRPRWGVAEDGEHEADDQAPRHHAPAIASNSATSLPFMGGLESSSITSSVPGLSAGIFSRTVSSGCRNFWVRSFWDLELLRDPASGCRRGDKLTPKT